MPGAMDSPGVDPGTTAIVLRNVNVQLLSRLMDQQRQDGRAAVQLIEGSTRQTVKGANESGKGTMVDVVA